MQGSNVAVCYIHAGCCFHIMTTTTVQSPSDSELVRQHFTFHKKKST